MFSIYRTRLFQRYRQTGDKIREWAAMNLLKLFPSVKPNEITVLSFFIGCIAALCFATDKILLGALFYYISDVLDGVDGIVARYKKLSSPYGAFLDSCLDRYVDGFVTGGIMLYLYRSVEMYILIIVGMFAFLGIFLGSYSAHRAEALQRVVLRSWIPFERRVRMHVIVLCALLNQLFYSLIIIGIIGNLNMLLRLRPSALKNPKRLKKSEMDLLPKTSLTMIKALQKHK